jgi:hypothetical protein
LRTPADRGGGREDATVDVDLQHLACPLLRAIVEESNQRVVRVLAAIEESRGGK